MEAMPKGGGGRKQLWIRQHAAMILDFYNTFGRDKTMQQFDMQPGTLDHFLKSQSQPVQELTEVDIAVSRIETLEMRARDAEHRLDYINSKVNNAYSEMTEEITAAIARDFFEPMLQFALDKAKKARKPEDDPLALDGNDLRLNKGDADR